MSNVWGGLYKFQQFLTLFLGGWNFFIWNKTDVSYTWNYTEWLWMVSNGKEKYQMVRKVTEWFVMTWTGMDWYGLVWTGMDWYGMIRNGMWNYGRHKREQKGVNIQNGNIMVWICITVVWTSPFYQQCMKCNNLP